jgi:hypothetical protein
MNSRTRRTLIVLALVCLTVIILGVWSIIQMQPGSRAATAASLTGA